MEDIIFFFYFDIIMKYINNNIFFGINNLYIHISNSEDYMYEIKYIKDVYYIFIRGSNNRSSNMMRMMVVSFFYNNLYYREKINNINGNVVKVRVD